MLKLYTARLQGYVTVTTAACPWVRLPAAPVVVLVLLQDAPEYDVELEEEV